MAAGPEDQQLPESVRRCEEKEMRSNTNNMKIEAFSAQVVDTMASKVAEKDIKDWNTKNLSSRLMADAGCAAAAGFLVAPIVSMVDKAIMENASGKRPLMQSIKASVSQLLFRPHAYVTSKPFALILMVYGGTYLSANFLDTFKSTIRARPASSTSAGPAKFAATSAANISLTMIKDSQFTKMYSTVAARPVPPVTFAFYALRDSMTIFASFNLPQMIAPNLPLSETAEKYISRTSAAQFLAPAGIQLLSTPLHLLGLDMYNRNGDTTVADRMRKVRTDWLKSSVARMCRIVPAFGFGGVVNNGLRLRFQKQLE
ncbi:hypothetical protein Slin14017_G036310 [Septoria linicola]|nr:hypothetical protein Slin14017_G036310 [Septoria linicola]